jgi:hypothetical protein
MKKSDPSFPPVYAPLWLAVFVCAFILAACPQNGVFEPGIDPFYTISGMIRANDGVPAKSAVVQLKKKGVDFGSPVIAAADGAYFISGISAGTYTLEASLYGYDTGMAGPFTVNRNVSGINLVLIKTVVNNGPPDTGVTISPAAPYINKGDALQFSARVTAPDITAQTVTWTVTGGVPGTRISGAGRLTVSADETAEALTVTAASTEDPGKYGTATVRIATHQSLAAVVSALLDAMSSISEGDPSSSYTFVLPSGNESTDGISFSCPGTSPVTIAIDGGGRTISLSGAGSLFTVESGVTLKLKNIVLRGRGDRAAANPSLIKVDGGGTLELDTGTLITANRAASYGGGVYVSGTLIMKGGEISGNSASYGGGGVYGFGTFTMSGGKISGNSASYGGGGVSVPGTFTMNGGEISGNTAYSGGGLYITPLGIFTMNGGKISGNVASSDGGAVCLNASGDNDRGIFAMNGGEISGNTAYSGGGLRIFRGTFIKKGGILYGNDREPAILKNTAGAPGGHAIYLDEYGKIRNATAGPELKLYAKYIDGWTYNDPSPGGLGNTADNW